jgi:hypothetical protein
MSKSECQINVKQPMSKVFLLNHLSFGFHLAGKCPDKPRLLGGFEGHNMKETSLPGSVAFWAEGFNFEL